MVQPQILHPNTQISNITRQFRDAASRLQPGKLVKDEDFTLFEAVGALEIGDPKMDSGSLVFDPDLDEELGLSTVATAEETVWLMDELIRREVAWHMGYPLSQTLFTSVHIERLLWPVPRQLTDARFDRGDPVATRPPSLILDVFQPYCIGLIKCCDLVLSMITSEHYYEEEDFATQIYNRPLLHDFPVDEVLVMLQNARIWLHDSSLPAGLKDALKARLDLRQSLLGLFQSCALGDRSTIEHLDRSIAYIKMVESSAILGRATANEAFTLKIQRKLASSVPPRPMVAIERPKAFDFLRQLITESTIAFQVFDITASGDLLVAYQTFMAQSPQPAIYVRALLQSFLTCHDAVLGKFAVKDFIAQDIQSLVRPIVPLLDHGVGLDDTATDAKFHFCSRLDSFMNRCGHSFLNLFRTFCLNRCRVRRTLCHAALEWDQIQAEAEEMDTLAQSLFREEPMPYPPGEELTLSYSLSSWVYHHKLMQLRIVVQTGFELSIYAPHEFTEIYWYLSFLSSTHLSHLERISFFVSSKQLSAQTSPNAVRETLRNLYRHFTWLKATEAMSKALHRVLVVIQRHGQLTNPNPAYASELLRYELRMRPFMHLSVPEPIDVDVAKDLASLRNLSDPVILQQASQLIQVARKAWDEVMREKWHLQPLSRTEEVKSSPNTSLGATRYGVVEREWTKDVQNAMRACIGAGIAISTLSKAFHEGRIAAVKVEVPPVGHRDRWHSSWPVPRISG
ncbi:hypothetical protein A1O3_00003 [Capronia epimyces CBS 606.96]|uniref:Amino-acid N-acetyltransferase subunit Mak10 n=1 Tax=Capronia epimyces CBS 606.96 TaxID=1182542 RepID=W9YP68_9EURO|nr:uncharacterized protein A1O3_00003 [Capronia epimyces CBS 606.96]EXJ91455.1 hypothetical protein A1O3_00003 [Capronia epimyces CBS 606.96]